MDRRVLIQELDAIEKPSDLFDFIWRALRVPQIKNAQGVMELFSWAMEDWEDGPYATDERTIRGWLRNTTSSIDRPHLSSEKRAIFREVNQTLLEEFASVIKRDGFKTWDPKSTPPSKRECGFVAEVIVKAVQNKLRRRRSENRRDDEDKRDNSSSVTSNISGKLEAGSEFQRYCREKIGYFSRRQFFEDLNLKNNSTKFEEDIFFSFLSSSYQKYLVLHGPGGSGKTSTLHHIAHLAESAENINVLYVRSSAKFQPSDLVELAEGKTHIVFVDYIENCSKLKELSNWVEENQHIDAKFVLACRNSSFEKISTSLNPRRCIGESISIEHEGRNYQAWIVEKILTRVLGDNFSMDIVDLFGGNPAFAAYFAYHASLNANDAASSFGGEAINKLQFFGNFRDWLGSRLCLALGKPHNELGMHIEDSEIAQIFFCLPAPVDAIALSPVFEALIDDGFIVQSRSAEGEAIFAAIHDVFADMAILLWIESAVTPSKRLRLNRTLNSIPAYCSSARCLQSFFVTLDRLNLSADPAYAWLELNRAASEVVLEAYDKSGSTEGIILLFGCREISAGMKASVLSNLIQTNEDLLPDDHRLDLLYAVFHRLLDLTDDLDGKDDGAQQFVSRLVDVVIEQERADRFEYDLGRGSTKLAIAAYVHSPEHYEEYLLSRFLREWRSNWKTLYILIAFVNYNDCRIEFTSLFEMFQNCAKRYYSSRDFGYVLHRWIIRFGSNKIVRKYVSKWLESYSADGDMYMYRKEGFILITTWIRSGNSLLGIKSVVTRWTDQNRRGLIDDVALLVDIFFKSDEHFLQLSNSNKAYISEVVMQVLRSPRSNGDSPLTTARIAANLFLRCNEIDKLFDIVARFMSEVEILHLLKVWRPPLGFAFFVVLANFQKQPFVNEGEGRKTCAPTLVMIDQKLVGHPARRHYREWLSEWLSKDDKGRKSFFHWWFKYNKTLEPFERQALECYYFGENKVEMDGYSRPAKWVEALMKLTDVHDRGSTG